CKQYQLPEDAPVEDILSARKAALREAIGHTLADLAYRLAEQSGEDRAKADALTGRLTRVALFSVSAPDYLACVRKKGRDRPRLEDTDQTELPALKQPLADLARDYGTEHHDRLIRQQLQTLLREADRELQAQRVRLDQRLEMAAGQRKEVQAAAAAALTFLGGKLTEYRERYAQ